MRSQMFLAVSDVLPPLEAGRKEAGLCHVTESSSPVSCWQCISDDTFFKKSVLLVADGGVFLR